MKRGNWKSRKARKQDIRRRKNPLYTNMSIRTPINAYTGDTSFMQTVRILAAQMTRGDR